MSPMTFVEQVGVLFLSSLVFLVPILVLVAVLSLSPAPWRSRVLAAIPAFIATCLAVILFDNFTYTVFRFGIVNSLGLWRVVYGAGVLVVFFICLRKFSNDWENGAQPAWHGYLFLPLLSISAFTFMMQVPRFDLDQRYRRVASETALPHIILLGIDGVNATHMSVYGYERQTTPNLEVLSRDALVIQNGFPNAGKTGGSLTSLLTGKASTETRVIFPPDILIGEDAYEHLPGILRQLGYSTVQVSMPYYGDAYERNVRAGFDSVNFRSQTDHPLLVRLARMGGGGGPYFAGQVITRITERLAHIFFIKPMQDPYAIVTQHAEWIHDDERLAAAYRYLDEADRPLFLHLHLMDMHGPAFHIPHPAFSRDQTPLYDWNTDFYDDAILGADRSIRELFDHLSETGETENTIVILYSDHGMEWDPLVRVPLMFWFPDHEYQGTISENAQLLDIAPTILDYLNVPSPQWMEGQSLLSENLSATRPIFSATVGDEMILTEDRSMWMLDATRISPPFYQLGRLNLVVCNTWFSLNLRVPELTYGEVAESTTTCEPGDVPSPREAQQMMVQYLLDDGYDMSGFPAVIPVREIKGTD